MVTPYYIVLYQLIMKYFSNLSIAKYYFNNVYVIKLAP
jgi:hypothetical protein